MKVFLSHASADKPLVDAMRRALDDSGHVAWLDARELRGGEILDRQLPEAIEQTDAFLVFVSPVALQSSWVGRELTIALEIQKQRGRDKFPVVPLAVDGMRLGVLEQFFGGQPLYVPVSSQAGGVLEALPAIFTALGTQLALAWELLRDDRRFLFQGKHAVRVRRRLPHTRDLELAVVRPRSACCWLPPAGTRRCTPTGWAPSCATSASRWCSWKPARRPRPRLPPGRSPRSCSRRAWPRWWR